MKRLFCILLAATAAMGSRAATSDGDENSPQILSDSILVTANRFGLNPKRVVWPTTLVKSESLRDQESLEPVLDSRHGLDVRNYSGFGSVSTLSSWGVFNRHILLLYNGRVVKDFAIGGFNLSDYSSDEFERVEILKGPQSAFYGSDAVGGVVNLISPSSLTDNMEIAARQGSNDFRHYHFKTSRRLGFIGLSGFGEFSSADNNRPNAGSERRLYRLRADYLSPDSRHLIAASGRYFNDSLGVPGPVPEASYIPVYGSSEAYSLYDHQEDENYSFDFQYRYANKGFGMAQLDFFWEKKNLSYSSLYNYQYDYYTYENPPDSSLNTDSVDVYSDYITNKRSLGGSARLLRQVDALSLAGGIDFLSAAIRATNDERSQAFNTAGPSSPYAYSFSSFDYWRGTQEQYDLWSSVMWPKSGWVELDINGRLQFVSGRKRQPSYNLGLIVTPFDNWSVKAGYAYAFRLPSLAEQFTESIFTAGNKDLSSETSRAIVATLSYHDENGVWNLSTAVFHHQVDSLIQYQLDPVSFKYVPQNVDKFKSTGLDASFSVTPKDWLEISLSGVYQKAKQTASGEGGFVDAFFVPDLKGRLEVTAKTGAFSGQLNGNYSGERYMIISGSRKSITEVFEVGGSLSFDFTSRFRLSVTAYDVTDQKRPDQFGFTLEDGDYPTSGRRVILSAGYKVY